jgi:hypothetical protein
MYEYLIHEDEAKAFRSQGVEPIGFFESHYRRFLKDVPAKKREVRIIDATKVHDHRDGKDYLLYHERLTDTRNRAHNIEASRGVHGIPTILEGHPTDGSLDESKISYESVFEIPFTRDNISKIVPNTDKDTKYGFSEFKEGGTCCKNYEAVSQAEFLEGAL